MSRRAGSYIWSEAGSSTCRLNPNYLSRGPDAQEEDCLARFAKSQTRNGKKQEKEQVLLLIVYLRDSPQSACSMMEDGG